MKRKGLEFRSFANFCTQEFHCPFDGSFIFLINYSHSLGKFPAEKTRELARGSRHSRQELKMPT